MAVDAVLGGELSALLFVELSQSRREVLVDVL